MKIIIGGAGAVGTHLAKLLSHEQQDCVLIDEDDERLNGLDTSYDMMTMQGSPTSIRTLKDAGCEGADLFVGVTPEESRNVNACIIAHALGAKKTVARIDNYEYLDPKMKTFFNNLGIDSLIYPEVLAAKDIINGLKLSWVRQRWDVHDGALVMLGIKLREGCEILNQPLKELCGPDDPYHIVAIKHGDETIIPGGNDVLQLHDLAYFMTTREYIPYIRKIVGKEHYADVKNVIVMGLSEGNFPNMWFAREKDDHGKAVYLNDLLKSMFVAATRTKGDLYLTYAQKNQWGYAQMPSRFLRSLR